MCAECIAVDQRPLSIVKYSGFRAIIEEFSLKINHGSHQFISRFLRKSETFVDNLNLESLSKLPIRAGTTDVWNAEHNDSYSSLNVSYID